MVTTDLRQTFRILRGHDKDYPIQPQGSRRQDSRRGGGSIREEGKE